MLVAHLAERSCARTKLKSVPITSASGDRFRRLVMGTPCTGIRVDVRTEEPSFDLSAFRFALAIAPDLPLQLSELHRLLDYLRSGVETPSPGSTARGILLLRTIDALGEGASLRTIGEGLVRAGDWPGAGESTKSRARRLAASAQKMWKGGPRDLLRHR